MGKKQHQKDKLYLTTTEWKNEWGGYKGTQNTGQNARFRRLPFHSCSLSMQPFEHPLCMKDGVIFDLMNIVPFLKKYGLNPATGEKMSAKDLIKLTFHKNSDGKYHCPVTYKVFNENSNIVAIRQSGNVYALEAVERLNLKTNNLKDLITDEPFTRKDVITIQDPTELEKFNLANFYHIKNNLKVLDEEEEEAKKDPRFHLKTINSVTKEALDELERDYKPSTILDPQETEKRKLDKFNAATYSTGMVAASFTSTAMDRQTQQVAALIDEDLLRYERVKKKGYVRMMTSKGPLNLELHCDMIPKACENFMKLCSKGYYNGTIFHRSIRNFIIQGGDPTATGKGGDSAFGGPFKDHFKPNLTHTGRGVLSMANSGPDTNKSQFFFTYRSARHLDGKHTVFGRVVGGMETIDKMEKVEVDKKDRPKEEIRIEECIVFVNPFDEADEMLQQERDDEVEREKNAKEAELKKKMRKKMDEEGQKVFKTGVGKYINIPHIKRQSEEVTPSPSESAKKKTKTKTSYGFGDFSAW
ncbi:RING-type E3 ubiquitin-protein ligase PPIL2-like [Gigantopelta aegis]|uniref:RING-type E3 ubiquitin-protein ligase PPIL2-like n=1 Tax=Gigantopelta aegis TaxID=1735272 RepID=UPI001B88AE67|nr:RING-type E3 ubiquitin-protein ligase PPIL2-like [Gigantopelta aegis]